MFQINLHELTACVYYKLAIERGLRGCFPECEAEEHTPTSHHRFTCMNTETEGNPSASTPFSCKDAQDKDISTAIR